MRLLIAANVASMFRDFLNPFALHFRAKHWEVDAMAQDIKNSPDRLFYDRTWDVRWSRNPLAMSNIASISEVRNAIEWGAYDLLHVHTPIPAFICRYAARRCRTPRRPSVIYTAHGFHFHPNGSSLKNAIFMAAERLAGRWTDYLVVINSHDHDAAMNHRIVPEDRLVYMPGIGVRLDEYSPRSVSAADVCRVRNEFGLQAEDVMILMVAEFTPGKRHRDAIAALAKVRSCNAHLVFAGEGPLVPAVRTMVTAHGLDGRVHFAGFRRDIPALLRSSAMLVLPSEREGLPRSVMEALCMGLPVIGSDVRGIRDLLADAGGLLIPTGDTTRLAECIDWVIANPDEARQMAHRGQSQVHRYDFQNVLKLHEQLYDRALEGAAKR